MKGSSNIDDENDYFLGTLKEHSNSVISLHHLSPTHYTISYLVNKVNWFFRKFNVG